MKKCLILYNLEILSLFTWATDLVLAWIADITCLTPVWIANINCWEVSVDLEETGTSKLLTSRYPIEDVFPTADAKKFQVVAAIPE